VPCVVRWPAVHSEILKDGIVPLGYCLRLGIRGLPINRSSPDHRYRTTPLRGLGAARMKGGFYHDGRFATLEQVVAHYDAPLRLSLSSSERRDLVEYLKSL